VGNPTPVMQEATRLGKKWMALVPVMLHARPLLEPRPAVSSPPGPEHGLSVAAMGDAADGPVFLVVVNEDLAAPQGGKVRLPDAFAAGSRGVYDLDALDAVPMTHKKEFHVETLEPGDGRVYLLGTQGQFAGVRSSILTNGVKEQLRVQAADRVLAQRWGLSLDDYQAAVGRVEELLNARQFDKAIQASAIAARALEETMAMAEPLSRCRQGLLAVRKDLGAAIRRIFLGENTRPGQEARAESCRSLCEQYGRLRGRYIMGQTEGLVGQVDELRERTTSLLAEMGEDTPKP